MSSNNFEITFIFQCLIIHFYLIHVRPVEVKNLNECVVFEVSIKNKMRCVVSFYRSPSQTQNEFKIFLISLQQLIGDIVA